MTDKMSRLRGVMDQLNAQKAKEKPGDDMPAVFIAGERPDLLNPGIIPSTNIAFNNLMRGGARRGAFTELVGNAGVGKTHLSFDALAGCQQDSDGIVIYLLSEGAFPMDAAQVHNIDMNRLVIIDGFFSAEEGLDQLKGLLIDENLNRRNLVDMVVIDSISGMRPRAEVKAVMEEGFAKDTVGRHAAMWSRAFPVILPCMHNTAFILINQYRNMIGGYGAPQIKTGGHAAGYYPHVSLKVATTRDDLIYADGKKSGIPIGHTVKLRVEKTKGGVGGKLYEEASYDVYYQIGADHTRAVMTAACALGIIVEPSKAWYQFNLPQEVLAPNGLWKQDKKISEPLKLQGEQKVLDALRNCSDIRSIVERLVQGETAEDIGLAA